MAYMAARPLMKNSRPQPGHEETEPCRRWPCTFVGIWIKNVMSRLRLMKEHTCLYEAVVPRHVLGLCLLSRLVGRWSTRCLYDTTTTYDIHIFLN